MAMPRNLPFEVRLHFPAVGGGWNTRRLMGWTDDSAMADIDATFLTEYVSCDLEFAALDDEVPADARLHVDGLEALVDSPTHAAGRDYITCGERIPIQRYDETEFPWIPGNYGVEVQWGGRSYHTVLHVKPKDMHYDQLQLMREQLERYVVGLALSYIRRKQGLGNDPLNNASSTRFYQYQLLEQNFARIYAVLQDIVQSPKHEAGRHHAVRPTSKTSHRDAKSYQWLHSAAGYVSNHGRTDHHAPHALAPISAVYYDLPENQWVKRIVGNLISLMDEIAGALSTPGEVGRVDSVGSGQRAEQVDTVRRLQSRLRSLLTDPLFDEVQEAHTALPYTPAMQRDGRYRTLYRFWWDLINHSELRVNASFAYQWKKTDLLWEYWSLVRTIEAMEQLGFEPVTGWIYDEPWQFPDSVFIPSIPDGTKVVMARGEERVAIHFSERLPQGRDAAVAVGSLLYAEERQNWPDIRIDYYRYDVFEHSVVIDAKYRKSRHIGSNMRQLNAYRLEISRSDDPMRRAVRKVIVLYPHDPALNPVHTVAAHVVLIQLVPGEEDGHFVEHLAQMWPAG